MLLTLLCLCQASAEWVEISQQTYRKPLTPLKTATTLHQPFSTSTEALLPMTKRSDFFNQSLTDKHWSKGSIIRVPHVGSVKRVQAESARNKTKMTTSEMKRPIFKDNTQNYEGDGDKLSMKLNLYEQNNVTQTTEEKFGAKFQDTSIRRNPFLKVDHLNKSPANRFPINDQLTENTSQIDEERNGMGLFTGGISKESIKLDGPKRNVLGPYKPYQTVDHHNEHHNDVINENIEVTHRPTSQFITQIEDSKSSESYESVLESDDPISIDRKKPELASSVTKENTSKRKTQTREPNTSPAEGSNAPKAESPKVNTMENVLKILKLVSKTISQNTKQSFGSKIKYLHNLKNTIMANIESHIDVAWPAEGGRRTRALADARGHVDFPSSESALMTISFLTFAVFLIKLVLQVIQKYKNTSLMTNAVVAVQRAARGPARAPPTDAFYD